MWASRARVGYAIHGKEVMAPLRGKGLHLMALESASDLHEVRSEEEKTTLWRAAQDYYEDDSLSCFS